VKTDYERGILLLFSGGLDSTALAAILRPKLALFVDYGQRPAAAEGRAAKQIAEVLGLPFQAVELGIRAFGSGLLHDEEPTTIASSPSPEWWPYRNQFLATAASAIALKEGCGTVALGTVRGDGLRHRDGTQDFYTKLDALVRAQEGDIGVVAPALDHTTEEILLRANVGESVLGWTISCHRSNLPCGECPGCWKRQRVLATIGIEGYSWNTPKG
jgi:7-cyano-7-deazaguanine synthase